MLKKIATALAMVFMVVLLSVTQNNAIEPAQASELQQAADLAAVKAYALDHAQQMKAATAALKTTAERYYILIEASDFDYETAFAQDGPLVAGLVQQAKDQWIEASTHYELDEGIIAGVPSLAFYDVWIDAGAPLADDPEGLEWTLELPDRTLDSPGNFFHNLLEPALYGTVEEYVGAEVDLDGNGTIELGESLPEANIFLGAAQGLDQATAEMNAAIEA
ncbi:MAG: hypothetical protein KDJ65_34870, partial [Anaerolineae bacterium]|nr:hypothetical protein [Anaerolineae bacterium]